MNKKIVNDIVNDIEFNSFKFMKIGAFFTGIYVVSKIFQKSSVYEILNVLCEFPMILINFGLLGGMFGYVYGLNKNEINPLEVHKYTLEITNVVTNRLGDWVSNTYKHWV